VDGRRHSVLIGGGVRIGLLTAGAGRALLLVHGGMSRLEAWEPIWKVMAQRWRVTAIDRRGRGASGDGEPYAISQEYDDIVAVAAVLADQQGGRSMSSPTATARAARWEPPLAARRFGESCSTSLQDRGRLPASGSGARAPWPPTDRQGGPCLASSLRSSV